MTKIRHLIAPLALALALPIAAQAQVSTQGVVPSAHPGNFVSSDDDQVCYDMSALGFIGEVTTEMRGIKIDPPTHFDDNFIGVSLTNNGRSLEWALQGATMVAVIVKGGPSYHVYNYVGTGLQGDAGLVSPLNRRNLPAVSHYNLCYAVDVQGGEGCTPGYWRNHADRWAGVAPSDSFNATFGVQLFVPDITLGQAIQLGGGGVNALARHATAGLLNALGGVPNADGGQVNYPFGVAEVTAKVQAAASGEGDVDAIKDTLAAANELGCPLGGTRANPVP